MDAVVYLLRWIIGLTAFAAIIVVIAWQVRGMVRSVREDISKARKELSIFLDKLRQDPKRTTLEVVSSVGLIVLVLLILALMMLNRNGLFEFFNSAFVKIIFFASLIISELGLWFRLRRLSERFSLRTRINYVLARAFVWIFVGGASLLLLNLGWSR